MTEDELEEALAAAIEREHAARQVGAADQQAQAMNEIRQLRAAEKQRRHRARVKAGIMTYTAELDVKATDELVYDAGLETFGELCQLLLKLDARLRCVTVDRRGLAGVVLSLAEELRLTEDKTP